MSFIFYVTGWKIINVYSLMVRLFNIAQNVNTVRTAVGYKSDT